MRVKMASLNQISYFFEQLRKMQFRFHGELLVNTSWDVDPNSTYSKLWKKLYDSELMEGRVTENKYKYFLSLIYNIKHKELEAELDKLQ
jgi:hypothetical protein